MLGGVTYCGVNLQHQVVLAAKEELTALRLCQGLGLSKQGISRVFARRQLSCEGRPLVRDSCIAAGSEVLLELHVAKALPVLGDAGPARILWQDRFVLAAEKPAGLLVHGDGTGSPTLADAVHAALVLQGEGLCRVVPQPLQRLDVPTSGIVLFSLTEEFQPAFDALVASHGPHMRKRYYALVDKPLPKEFNEAWHSIEAPLARDRHDARRMRVGSTGKRAVTRVRMVQRMGRRTLVEAELVTGRKHQIRVHLYSIGCPIVGDALYGGTPNARGLMLHAHEVRFVHPVTGERVTVRSQIPKRFCYAPKV